LIDQTGVALNTVITSNAITVAGINTAASISITGGAYAINGGAYTGESGTVSNGETVTVQQPVVIRERCIGCGICENHCPLEGDAAIQVYGM
jgi:NAD-dependent dihydropyrimidine dehydrogenase PreA subunit